MDTRTELTANETAELRALYDLEIHARSVNACYKIEKDYFDRITAVHGIDASIKTRTALWRRVAETRQKQERESAVKYYPVGQLITAERYAEFRERWAKAVK